MLSAVPIVIAIGAAVTSLIATLVEAIGKKTVIAAALILAMVAAYTTLQLAIDAVISTIPIGTMPVWIVTGITMMPTNTDDCLTAMAISYVARMTFDASMQAIHIRAAS